MKLFWLMEPTETGVGGGLSCCPRDLRVGGGGASASGFAFPGLQAPLSWVGGASASRLGGPAGRHCGHCSVELAGRGLKRHKQSGLLPPETEGAASSKATSRGSRWGRGGQAAECGAGPLEGDE